MMKHLDHTLRPSERKQYERIAYRLAIKWLVGTALGVTALYFLL